MAPRPSPFVQVGVSVVVTRLFSDGKWRVLLGRRQNSFGNGLWSVPGGKPDAGETPKEAAVRELREETGLEAIQCMPLPVWAYQDFDDEVGVRYVDVYFWAHAGVFATPRNLEPDKCKGWEWVAVDEVEKLSLFSPSLPEALRSLGVLR